MAKLFHRLATGYAAGIDIRSIYRKETEIGSPSYRVNSQKIFRGVSEGKSLAQAMQSVDGYFPELAITVVQAGERGGRLEESFARLSHHYDSLVKFRNTFLMSIAWPVFELFAAIFIVGLLILIMGWIFETGNIAPIDWFGLGLSTMGNFVLYWTIMLVIFGSLFILILGIMKGWFGTLPMKIARQIPLVGKTIESLALSRLAWTMSVSENAGMDAADIVRLALRSTQNYYYQRLEPQTVQSITRGLGFYQAFQQTGAFPADFLIYVENGETAGELAETMDRASIEHQQRAELNMKIIGTVGFILMLLFVFLVLGTTIIMMYQRLYIDQINQFL